MKRKDYVKPSVEKVEVKMESLLYEASKWTNDTEQNPHGYWIIDGDPGDNSEWDPEDY